MLIGISGKIGSGKDTFALLIAKAIIHKKYPGAIGSITQFPVDGIEVHKFADAPKDITCILTGCTRVQLEDQDFKDSVMPEQWWQHISTIVPGKVIKFPYDGQGTVAEHFSLWKPTYRQFLQELDTNVLRNWVPNIHVNATFATWKPVPVSIKDAKIAGWGKAPGGLTVQEQKWPKWIITDVRFPNEAKAIKERGGILIRLRRDTAGQLSTHPFETLLDNYQEFDAIIDNNGTMDELYQHAISIVNTFNLTNDEPNNTATN